MRRGVLGALGLALLALAAGLALVPVDRPASSQRIAPLVEVPAGTVLLRDDFDQLDLGRWDIDRGKTTLWVDDGQLVLGLRFDPEVGWLRQARIDATGVPFTYGTVRMRMRFLGPKGGHAAGWAPSVERHGSVFCGDGCSEVDVVEHFGAPARVYHTVWWAEVGLPELQRCRPAAVELDPTTMHRYRVDWTPTSYTFVVDGVVTGTCTVGLSNRPHVVALSYLSSDWERDDLLRDQLGSYRALVDWVEVVANEWTTTP